MKGFKFACNALSSIPFAGIVLHVLLAVNSGVEMMNAAEKTAKLRAITRLVPDSDPCSMGLFAESLARAFTLAKRRRIYQSQTLQYNKKDTEKQLRVLLEKYMDKDQLDFFFTIEHPPIIVLAMNDFKNVMECVYSKSFSDITGPTAVLVAAIVRRVLGFDGTDYRKLEYTIPDAEASAGLSASSDTSLPVAAEVTMSSSRATDAETHKRVELMEQQLAMAQKDLAASREEQAKVLKDQVRTQRMAEKGEHALEILNALVSVDSKGDHMTATMKDANGNVCIKTTNPLLESRMASLEQYILQLTERLDEQNEVIEALRREKKKKSSAIANTKKELTKILGIE